MQRTLAWVFLVVPIGGCADLDSDSSQLETQTPLDVRQEDDEDQLVIRAAVEGADWSQYRLRSTQETRYALNARADPTSPLLDSGWSPVTDRPQAIRPGDFLSFCSPDEDRDNVTIDLRRESDDYHVGQFDYFRIDACRSSTPP